LERVIEALLFCKMQQPSPVGPAKFAGSRNQFSAQLHPPVGFEILFLTYKYIKIKWLKIIHPLTELTDVLVIRATPGFDRWNQGNLHNAKLARLFLQNAS
jgi:hypothetical protein